MEAYQAMESGNTKKAIPLWEDLKDVKLEIQDYVLFYLGKAYLIENKCDLAFSTFSQIVLKHHDSRWFDLARQQVESKEACPPLTLPKVEMPRITCEESQETVEGKANCYFQARLYAKALPFYQSLVEGARAEKKIFYLTRISQAAARSQNFEAAIKANKEIMALFPRQAVASEAERKIAFLHQDGGDYEAAIKALESLSEKAKSPSERRLFWEKMAWCYYRLDNFLKALEYYNKALKVTESPLLLYWKARSLEQLRQNPTKGSKEAAAQEDEVEAIYQGLISSYPHNYYSLRALEKLNQPYFTKRTLRDWWPEWKVDLKWRMVSERIGDVPLLKKIYDLASLGMDSDARAEIRRIRFDRRLKVPMNPHSLQMKGNSFFVMRREPEVEHEDHPIPYIDEIMSLAENTKFGMDPYFLYAIMKQESRFNARVVSPAGAIGLLQIMPLTGQRLAESVNWDRFEASWLFDPSINIELSVVYFEKLFDEFPKWYQAAASYNAGENVVREWARLRKNHTEEEFIEEIPYAETRDYVKKVYTNWEEYRHLYALGGLSKPVKSRTKKAASN